MATRRHFLKSLSLSPLAVPFVSPGAAAWSRDAGAPLPAPDDPAFWAKVREQFLLAPDKAFFNTGTHGAMPKVVVDAVTEHLRRCATEIADWDYHGADWIAGYQPMTEIRAKVARLLNADVGEIALTENVTTAMNGVAQGLDLAPGDEVVATDQEHIGGKSPWELKARRWKTVFRPMPFPKPVHDPQQAIDVFRKAMTPRTKVFEIQHIITGSGAVLPVKALCAEARAKGIFTVVDGAQAVGHIPVDLRDLGCDAYVGCFHKWMLAPAGTGFLYVRKDRIRDIWTTMASGQWDNHQDEGFRLSQRGTGSLSILMGLDAALDFHFKLGPERVQQRIKYLGDRLRDGLRAIPKARIFSPDDPAMCAGITVWNIEGMTGAALQDALWTRGRLRPRASGEVFGVRQSTHIYNSVDEVDRTVAIARAVAEG
ncbi:MAG TPA: aminotransferase class V-fold PLP-dependent enzyme [Vicinamibacterales bacterium]|jgi:selenocysteine lyase/cysteine desulfurase